MIRLGALLTGLGLLATPVVGGIALLGKGLLVAFSCLALLLALGIILHIAALPEDVRKRTLDQHRPDKDSSRNALTALARMLTLPMRARTVDVRSMSIKEVSGVTVVCDIRGSLRGVAPTEGDMVEVYGRRRPDGTVIVRSLVDSTSANTVLVRTPPACAVARLASAAVVGIWAIAALTMAWLLVFGR